MIDCDAGRGAPSGESLTTARINGQSRTSQPSPTVSAQRSRAEAYSRSAPGADRRRSTRCGISGVSDALRTTISPWTLALRKAGMCGRSTTAAGRGTPGITPSCNLGSRTPRRKRSKPQSEKPERIAAETRAARPAKNVSFPHPTILAHTGIPSPDAIPETTIARRGGHRSERSDCAPWRCA